MRSECNDQTAREGERGSSCQLRSAGSGLQRGRFHRLAHGSRLQKATAFAPEATAASDLPLRVAASAIGRWSIHHSLTHERTSSEGGAAAASIAMSPSFHSIICLTKAQTAPSTAKTKEGETTSYNQFIVSTFIDKRRSKLAIARGRRSACSIRAIGRAPSCFGKSFAGKLPLRVGNMRMKKCFFVELTRGCLPCIISFGKMKVVNL